jgi:hypothetical protein
VNTQDKILRRVRKMINLANCAGASEGERDNAMRMVHATLAKYNISMTQVEAGQAPTEARERLAQAFLGKPWAIQIAAAIARMCFCHYYYQTLGGNAGPTQKANHVFIGLHSNVITAQEMARFVVESVNKEAQRYQRSIYGRYSDYRAFAQGAAMKIRQRCAEIEESAKKQGVESVVSTEADVPTEADDPALLTASGAGTALVLASLYQTEKEANEAWLKQAGVELVSGRRQTMDLSKAQARNAGISYGAKVSLHKQVK